MVVYVASVGWLDQWYDGTLQPRLEDTPAQIVAEELERLHRLHAIASLASTQPRRLGQEATSDELAADKRRCKRLAHASAQLILAWGGQPGGGTMSDINRAAAQVVWDRWWEQHQPWLLARRRYLATWAVKGSHHEKWAKSAIVRINNELSWLAYALRS